MSSARLLGQSLQAQRKSLARLASGSKITSPEDDTAGLAQASKQNNERLRTGAAMQNLENGISFLQTRDGGLQKIAKALDRMSELSVLALDVTKTDTDRQNYDKEFKALFKTISQVEETRFNGKSLFHTFSQVSTAAITWANAKTAAEAAGGHLATITSDSQRQQLSSDIGTIGDYWIGAYQEAGSTEPAGGWKWVTGESFDYTNWNTNSPDNSGGAQDKGYIYTPSGDKWDDANPTDTLAGYIMERGISVTFKTDGDGNSFTFDANVLPSISTGSIATAANAAAALTEVKAAIENIAKQRAQTGAGLTRLQSHLEEAKIYTENLAATVSRIMDTDVAQESTNFARQQILTQSGTAMLAQANLLPQAALRLLG